MTSTSSSLISCWRLLLRSWYRARRLDVAALEPLPAVTQVHMAPAQIAGLAWPAARPELMVDESEILRPLQPEGFDDELSFFGV